MLGANSGLAGLFFLALKCAASSTPIDPQIEIPGTYATGTLPLGPLWVSDVPGLVLGQFFGLLGSQIKLERLFLHSPVRLIRGYRGGFHLPAFHMRQQHPTPVESFHLNTHEAPPARCGPSCMTKMVLDYTSMTGVLVTHSGW